MSIKNKKQKGVECEIGTIEEGKKTKLQKAKGPEHIKIYTWQMEKFQVMLSDSDNIMVAVKIDSEPSDAIKKALINFTYLFETNYANEIKNFDGKLEVFNSAKPLAEEIFNLFLMQPQMLPMDISKLKTMKLTDEEKKLIKTAMKLQEERGYFFFTHLIKNHMEKYKINQQKIFKLIFDLHKKGAFLSIPPENVMREIEKRNLYKQIKEIEGINKEDIELLLKDLLASSPESRENLINKIKSFKKKGLSEKIKAELYKRTEMRKKRSELFGKIDEYLQSSDYQNALKIFEEIINISNALGDTQMANELTERAERFRQTIEQMAVIIPQLRSARNEALNKAELYELAGKYLEAAEFYEQAADYSMEIGEYEAAKEYKEFAEKMKSLDELAKLRKSLET